MLPGGPVVLLGLRMPGLARAGGGFQVVLRSFAVLRLWGILLATLGVAGAAFAYPPSGSNGVSGGYTGSSLWFKRMQDSAAQRALMKSAMERRTGVPSTPAPTGQVEFKVTLRFPGGARCSREKRVGLRLQCRDTAKDSAEKAPVISSDGTFTVSLVKGQTYDLCWKTSAGREPFTVLTVAEEGPARRTCTLEVTGSSQNPGRSEEAQPTVPPARRSSSGLSALEADRFDLGGMPARPSSFEEQQVQEAVQSASTPALKAAAHGRLGRYYRGKGDEARARSELAKAIYWTNAMGR